MEKKESMAMKLSKTKFETIPAVFNKAVEENGARVSMRTKDLGIWHDISWSDYYEKAKKLEVHLHPWGLKKEMPPVS